MKCDNFKFAKVGNQRMIELSVTSAKITAIQKKNKLLQSNRLIITNVIKKIN